MTAIAGTLARRIEIQLPKWVLISGLFGIGAILYVLFQGTSTLPNDDSAPLFLTLNGVRDWVDANRTINPLFLYVLGPIRDVIDLLDQALTFVLAQFSWVGLMALAGSVSLLLVSWRTAIVVVGSLLVIALLVLGPKRLPEVGKSIGEGLKGFKASLDGDHDDEPQVRRASVDRPAAPAAPAEPVAEPRRTED